jgi:hypothetical protein
MEKNDRIYISLDEAREELAKRWQNQELKKAIEDELGENFWPEFKNEPRGFLSRCLPSPDNGLTFFFQCSKYINAKPLDFEYIGDLFTSKNEEKKSLGELRITLKNKKYIVDIIDFQLNEKKKINEIITKTGESLVKFHHKLLDISEYRLEHPDMTQWFQRIGKASEYYYPFLCHFVAHGVLFEFFLDEDESENGFTNTVVLPALEKIKNKFGLKPLIIRLYPQNQNDNEDFYWFSYPSNINEYLIKYVKENKLSLEEIE